MATKFEDIVNGMINVGFGAAAVAAEKSKAALDDLNAKGQEVRGDAAAPDFARSVSDAFTQAGGTVSDVTERLSQQGETAAEKVLDELIRLRARQLSAVERDEFVRHVADVVKHADDAPSHVEVEVEAEVETAADDDAADAEDAADAKEADTATADGAADEKTE